MVKVSLAETRIAKKLMSLLLRPFFEYELKIIPQLNTRNGALLELYTSLNIVQKKFPFVASNLKRRTSYS